MNILYIILKHVIWRFQIYNLFLEIFKFREDKSNNVFREIRKCLRKTAKFEFFAKQIIYLESPDHAKIKAIMYFAKFVNAYVKPRNLNFSRNKLYIWNLQITCFKVIYNMFIF